MPKWQWNRDDSDLELPSSPFQYAVTHVFLPVWLPEKSDYTLENDLALARVVCTAAHAYSAHVYGASEQAQWARITKMLDNLQASAQSERLDEDQVISQLHGMQTGDILVFLIRPDKAAIILTKRENSTLFESFELFPSNDAIWRTGGSLIRSYPWSAVETPNEVFDDGGFQSELANFLSHRPDPDPDPDPRPWGYFTPSTYPQYITALTDILRGVDRSSDILRVTKHVRHHVNNPSPRAEAQAIWRRSSIWLLIRIAIQTSVDRSPHGRTAYKRFMLFFMCTFSRDSNIADLSSDLLHLMSCKVLRRLTKLGSSPPHWLSEMALETCACLGEILDVRRKQQSASGCPSPFRCPSQDELIRDTRLSLLNSDEYIRNALANPAHESVSTPFHPNHRRRGTIEDFLSSNGSFFEEAYSVDPDVTLYDVERSVAQGIDDWLACVTNVNEACTQLEILLEKFSSSVKILLNDLFSENDYRTNPERRSIAFLTTVELFVALDKLVVREIPMLADYSPEIPIAHLERLLLCKTTSLHRLSCAYQYLSMRHSQSRPGWSVLSDNFTKDSFPVRYYDQSPHLQELKARVEEDATRNVAGRNGSLADGVVASRSPLPNTPLQAKVVVFELQSPACLRIWRSVTDNYFDNGYIHRNYGQKAHPITDVPELQPYFVGHQGQPSPTKFHLAYIIYPTYSSPQDSPKLCYTPGREYGSAFRMLGLDSEDQRERLHNDLQTYGESISHTSNDVLAAQADCPAGLTLDEFITFAHLRSGGSLQWLNILRGLCSRTLNLRRYQVHYLLSRATFQVGPLDLNTGAWIWHQELQDSFFCNALLDELDSLFVEVGAHSIDGMVMSNISLLLTRVLASNPSKDVSERVNALLRGVRRKTFSWVQELSYDLGMSPTNKNRRKLLLDMAATCRSTFDVDPATLPKPVYSAEDVDALLSCVFFIHTLRPEFITNDYSGLLLNRDRRLSLAIEEILRDEILADPSDYGVDLAVARIFVCHKPYSYKWEQLQYPDVRWLVCKTEAIMHYPLQSVHINLLNGEYRVNGQLCGGLLHEICSRMLHVSRNPSECKLLCEQAFLVIPSNLPGMDLTTLSMTSEHKVHFSWQAENLVVRAQHCQSDDVLQLIPSRKLQQDLPPSLVDGHIHWLNLSTSVIEIRPLEKLWEESSENWKIDCVSGQYRMYRGREILVDIRSPTWAMVSKCLCNFYGCFDTPGLREEPEDKSRDLITTSSVDSVQSTSLPQLSVTLPRCGLSFFVNERKELESHDFKDMVYDEDQSIGALLGLENLLVLRPKSHLAGSLVPEALIPRRVLIPNGNLTTVRDHKVKIDAGFYSRGTDAPSYYTYDVDTELGCLIGNRSLESMGYLAYLHAMTSCYWPDPLTGKTGAHAALHLLQSAGCRSIMKPKTLPLPVSDPLTNYPQFNLTWYKICERYYWNCESAWGRCVSEEMDESKNKWARAMGRAAHLFPWNVTVPTTSEDRGPIFFLSQWQSDSKPEGDSASTVLASATPPALPRRAASLRYTSDNENAQWSITLDQLLFNRPAPELPPRHTSLPVTSHKTSLGDIPELNQLFPRFHIGRFDPPFKERYLALLETSTGVSEEPPQIHEVAGKNRIDTLRKHYAQCRTNYMGALSILKKRLGPTTNHAQALNQFGQWPPITPCDLLQCLAPTSTIKLSVKWKKCITLFALLLLDLQRSRRLLRFALGGLEEEFSKELENEGCGGWNAEEYPDWLLIQIQGNFLIRRNQAEIAMEMMSPRSGKNTVMQVNMGEGKSSVIIPIIAAALADGKQLVRVIVPKALTAQMFELLVARLGGLTNRPIYHLPFSRTPEYEEDGYVISLQIHDLRELMSQCMAKRGILLIQPEHVVSLKLMAVEQQVHKGKLAAGPFPKLHQTLYKQVTTALSLKSIPEASLVGSIFRWLSQAPDHPRSKDAVQAEYYKDPYYASGTSLQKLIQSHVRDIVDESDEIFHPRFQLIYTIGLEQHMDGYPDRWTITQQVLGLAKDHAHTISKNHPESMEYECGPPGSFPRVHFVQSSDVGRRLISLIIEDVMGGRLPNFNFQHIPTALHDAIRSFVSDEDILPLSDTAKDVEEYAKGSDQNHLWSGLLLLRGLLASGTLLFALTERRWRVDYGLISPAQQRAGCGRLFGSTSPTMLAVPYRAKDVPAPNTQFGHPDLTIILTCLSYYYTGLSKEQLRIAFEILLDQDDPSMEYALWVKGYDSETLPDSLRELGEINLESSEKWDNVIYPLFSRIQATIDLYLSQVVFPKEAKEFPWKISGSSWDLAEKREKLITGFSGTNDSRWLLPMSIAQHDLDHQKGTNARVLSYLLQPENDFYIVTRRKGDRQTTQLLRSVTMQRPEIRVLLDIGAQILDFSNRQVAGAWLDIAHAADGAIYFNENDELMILTRYSVTQPMLSSPLSHQVDRCIVYLDHAHTRGTDIKIPIESRAAVTLGPKVTKDALVQGCMRMRKLGRGHSVMFFAPPEVDQSIRAVAGKKDLNTRVTTADVLCWAINETWTDMQQRAPYWAQQGMNHKSRYAAWSRFCNNELTPELLSDAWLQPELKSLSNLYAPRESRNAQNDLSALDPGIRRRCEDLGIRSFPGARVEEELEREVQREREREREVELPPRARPARHNLHQDVVAFVKTGVIPPLQSGSAFLPVFTSLERSSAATRDSDVWSPLILATADFYNTIDPESTQGTMDQYLRPVQWILSRKQGRGQLLVLLSPFEANLLMPDIRASEYVHLHLYAPRTSQRMKPFDDLRLYSIPPLPSDWTPPWDLIDQLNMFAGQLYLRDYTSYLRLCRFLGVPTSMTDSPNDTAIRRNLFKIPGTFEEMEVTFSGSPLPPVMALLAIRNRRRPFARTHMGKILQGQLLEKKDFEVPTSAMSDHNPATTTEISDATSEPPQKRIRAD